MSNESGAWVRWVSMVIDEKKTGRWLNGSPGTKKHERGSFGIDRG